MRRFTPYLFVSAIAILVPTVAYAGSSPAQDPDGQALMAFEPWLDTLVQLFLTQLGI